MSGEIPTEGDSSAVSKSYLGINAHMRKVLGTEAQRAADKITADLTFLTHQITKAELTPDEQQKITGLLAELNYQMGKKRMVGPCDIVSQ